MEETIVPNEKPNAPSSKTGGRRRQGRGSKDKKRDAFRSRANEKTEQVRFAVEDARKSGVKEDPNLHIAKRSVACPIFLATFYTRVIDVYDHLIAIQPDFAKFLTRNEFLACHVNIVHAKIAYTHRKAQELPTLFLERRLQERSDWLAHVNQHARLLIKPVARLIDAIGNFEIDGINYVPFYDYCGVTEVDFAACLPIAVSKLPKNVESVHHPDGFVPEVPLPTTSPTWTKFYNAMHRLARYGCTVEGELSSGNGTPAQAVQVARDDENSAWSTIPVGSAFADAWMGYGTNRPYQTGGEELHALLLEGGFYIPSHVRHPSVYNAPYTSYQNTRAHWLSELNAFSMSTLHV